MPKFVTIGYGDQTGYDRTAPEIRDAAHKCDDELRASGAAIGIAGRPVQVRNPEAARLETQDGPFMSSPLPVAGFAIIEAPDLAEAIKLVSRTPCAVAHGVVEVWPLQGLSRPLQPQLSPFSRSYGLPDCGRSARKPFCSSEKRVNPVSDSPARIRSVRQTPST